MGWAARSHDGAIRGRSREETRQARDTARLKDLAGTIHDQAALDRVIGTVRPHMRAEVRALLNPLMAFRRAS
jgi:hypothetical protein